MNTASSTTRPRESRISLMIIIGALAAALLWFVGHKAHYFTDYSLESFSDYYWARRGGLLLHLVGGLLAIGIGLVQSRGRCGVTAQAKVATRFCNWAETSRPHPRRRRACHGIADSASTARRESQSTSAT